MNPLTLVKRTQKINSTEAALGISEEASWHAKYKDSAYIFVGGISFDLTEGDLLAVFAQYGEVVDVNLVRDKATGKSKGFAFLAYEDQRSTILAVDNLNGAKILGRIVRVDHVSNYKKKEEEDEEERQRKREARGVCRSFQRGECKWGDACKFSHDEQRCSNTGWGAQDHEPRWNHDRYDGPPKSHNKFSQHSSDQTLHQRAKDIDSRYRSVNKDSQSSRLETYKDDYRESKRDKYSEKCKSEGNREDRHDEEREKRGRHGQHVRHFSHHKSREDEEPERRAHR
ncbi:zinc finger CCCH domain-containing protein 25 [Canna indica]|uniref:Zinc finger CCCH domain-containing protein 25 n=1 Tax=Canna indica TaxID=4628 RepID=A0AAQ3KM60_9LILI|nr:zinc finger CCCH domain-containing protein 25 [Canna indica]